MHGLFRCLYNSYAVWHDCWVVEQKTGGRWRGYTNRQLNMLCDSTIRRSWIIVSIYPFFFFFFFSSLCYYAQQSTAFVLKNSSSPYLLILVFKNINKEIFPIYKQTLSAWFGFYRTILLNASGYKYNDRTRNI